MKTYARLFPTVAGGLALVTVAAVAAAQPAVRSTTPIPRTPVTVPSLPSPPRIVRKTTPPSARVSSLPPQGVQVTSDALRGVSSAAGFAGVVGITTSQEGMGVYGENDASGTTGELGAGEAGVIGSSQGGAGIFGNATTGQGVRGETTSVTDGAGVEGRGHIGVAAIGNGPTPTQATALAIGNGMIRVFGAGVGSPTPVFIVALSSATFAHTLPQACTTVTCECAGMIALHHPALDANPNAILFAQVVNAPLSPGDPAGVHLYWDRRGFWMADLPKSSMPAALFGNDQQYQSQCAGAWANAQLNVMIILP